MAHGSSATVALAFVPALVLAGLAAGTSGCRSDILKEPGASRPESGLDARVEVVAGQTCNGRESVVASPEHCMWPAGARRTMVTSAVVEVVPHVGADGRADSVRLVHAPAGHEFDEAAVACAMKAEYRAPRDENGVATAGEICPVRLRLERYASDVDPRPEPAFGCPPVRTVRPPQAPGASCEIP